MDETISLDLEIGKSSGTAEPEWVDDRESWLKFNDRIINEAKLQSNPIIERFRFLGIADNNLSEFIRTHKLNKRISLLIQDQTDLIEQVYEELEKELRSDPAQNDEDLYKVFINEVYPIVQPIRLSDTLPLPKLEDTATFFLVTVEDEKVLVRLPENRLHKIAEKSYISTVELMKKFIGEFFVGYEDIRYRIFRLYREIDSLYVKPGDNYVEGIRELLSQRKSARVVMLDVDDTSDNNDEIIEIFSDDFIVRRRRYVAGLNFLMDMDPMGHKTFEKFKQRKVFKKKTTFSSISDGDILVHFPYDSFDKSVVRFLEEAAGDANVLSISQTLYRVSKNSKIIDALCDAAAVGKSVTVLLELKAKLDEFENLKLIGKLRDAGVNIIFGDVTMKTHAKVILVVRREGKKLVNYSCISTGNYNEKTAKIYEDFALFSKSAPARDLHDLFNLLGGISKISNKGKLLVAPISFRSSIEKEIEKCISDGGSIRMKMNSLTDKKMARLLYRAAEAGVKIDLIVRGACIIKSTKNLRIRSIVGRFLEHSRVYEFTHDDEKSIYIGSGDIMPRNLDKRIEVLTPITSEPIRDHISRILDMYLEEIHAYDMDENGEYRLITTEPSIHQMLIERREMK